MRRLVIPALALLVAGGSAACANAPGTPEATPTPTATPVAACPIGNWKSTAVAASTTVAGTPVTAQGGSDVSATIAADGAVTADFGAMKPVTYTATVAGSEVGGELLYAGTLTGRLDLPAASSPSSSPTATSSGSTAAGSASSASTSPGGTATPSTGAGGAWRPVGPVNWGDLTLTVKLTKPVALAVVNGVKLTDVTNSQIAAAGNVVDLQPLLRPGTYRCDGNDTLVVTPSAGGGPTVGWTFHR